MAYFKIVVNAFHPYIADIYKRTPEDLTGVVRLSVPSAKVLHIEENTSMLLYRPIEDKTKVLLTCFVPDHEQHKLPLYLACWPPASWFPCVLSDLEVLAYEAKEDGSVR